MRGLNQGGCRKRRKLTFQSVEQRLLLTDFVVTTTADSGPGTLRQAIVDANANAGLDRILFDILADDAGHVYFQDDGRSGQVTMPNVFNTTQTDDADIVGIDPDWPHSWFTIEPRSALPAITDGLIVDGYSQPGASENTNPVGLGLNTVLRVELNGAQAGDVLAGFELRSTANDSSIRGVAVNGFPERGISLAASKATIEGVYVGTSVDGGLPLPNGQGLFVTGSNNMIGGTSPAARNLVSGNVGNGVYLSESSGNVVQGNLVGTNASGTRAIPQGANGVLLVAGRNSIIGGTDNGAGNLLSGNTTNGITLVAASHDNRIQGNWIGSDVAGNQDLGNGFFGVFAFQSQGSLIGGSSPGAGNLISGNDDHGVFLQEESGDATVQGNRIGTSADGNLAIGNGGAGIRLERVGRVLVGGPEREAGNTIAHNGADGVQIVDDDDFFRAQSNFVTFNSIFANAELGIDLGNDGTDYPPDLSTGGASRRGPNSRQNFPVIVSVTELEDATEIRGVIHVPSASELQLEFFASSEVDVSNFGEGQTPLGKITVTTDRNGAAFIAIVDALPPNQEVVTATATDVTIRSPATTAANNTSEFSPAFDPAVFVVTTTADAGTGSLRQAIIDANTRPGFDLINFAIPANDPGHVYYLDDGIDGEVTLANVAVTTATDDANIDDIDPDWPHSWFMLAPNSAYPTIADPLALDAYTQSGAVPNTQPVGQGLDTVIKVELNGENAGEVPSGLLHAGAGGSTFRGLAINRTQGAKLWIDNTGGNVVQGNFVGSDVSGTRDYPPPPPGGASFFDGIIATTPAVDEIGGTEPAARNLVSGNTGPTFRVSGVYAGGDDRVLGNLIGTDRTGTRALGNELGVFAGLGTVVGGDNPAARNVISGNSIGVQLGESAVALNNLVGMDVTGELPLGNLGEGIIADSNNLVSQNTVAFNAVGIRSTNLVSHGNLISRNSVHSNFGPGIDLGFDGITLNDEPPDSDPPDQDEGPNGLQNHPLLTSVASIDGATEVRGTLRSTPGATFRFEFFANPGRDEALGILDPERQLRVFGGFAQGQTYLGAMEASDEDADGVVQFLATLPMLPAGQLFLTATATDITNDGNGPRNNTSEFSPVLPLGGCSWAVTNTGDTGIGTLREAMFCSMLDPELKPVEFNIAADDPRHFYYRDDGIPGQLSLDYVTTTTVENDTEIPASGPEAVDPDWPHSWFSIQPVRGLPEIDRRLAIDGYTQPGSSRNSIAALGGLDTVLKIELDGSLARGDGLRMGFGAPLSRIEGLAINRFTGSGIQMSNNQGSVIAGNFIGTDVSGTLNLGNALHGVSMFNDSRLNRIGGAKPELRNLISGNESAGIVSTSTGADVIQGNLIGTNVTGEELLTNGVVGVFIGGVFAGSSLVWIGGIEPGAGNVIASTGEAVTIDVPAFDPPMRSGNTASRLETCKRSLHLANQARERLFETNDPGDLTAVELTAAIFFACATSFGQTDFIAQANPIIGNLLISAGEGLAIDLGRDGVTANDSDDPSTPEIDGDFDGGPNNLQNFPVLSTATSSGATTTITGTLQSLPELSFRIEFFSNRQLHPSGFGPGEHWLGFLDATTNGNGEAEFAFSWPIQVPAGRFVTSTATLLIDLDDDPLTPLVPLDTSEFSSGIEVVSADGVQHISGDLMVLLIEDQKPLRYQAVSIDSNSRLLLTATGSLQPGAHAVDIILASDTPVVGKFASVPEILPVSNGAGRGHLGHGLFFQGVRYNQGDFGVIVDVVQARSGDTDGDDDIDFTDFLALSAGFGQPGSWIAGDFDGDNAVGFGDFLALANGFGS